MLTITMVEKVTGTGYLLFGISSSPHGMATFATEIKPKIYEGGRKLSALSSLSGGPLTGKGTCAAKT